MAGWDFFFKTVFWGALVIDIVVNIAYETILFNLVEGDMRKITLILFWLKLWFFTSVLTTRQWDVRSIISVLAGPIFLFMRLSRLMKSLMVYLILTFVFYTLIMQSGTPDMYWTFYHTAASYFSGVVVYIVLLIAQERTSGRANRPGHDHPLVIMVFLFIEPIRWIVRARLGLLNKLSKEGLYSRLFFIRGAWARGTPRTGGTRPPHPAGPARPPRSRCSCS